MFIRFNQPKLEVGHRNITLESQSNHDSISVGGEIKQLTMKGINIKCMS